MTVVRYSTLAVKLFAVVLSVLAFVISELTSLEFPFVITTALKIFKSDTDAFVLTLVISVSTLA